MDKKASRKPRWSILDLINALLPRGVRLTIAPQNHGNKSLATRTFDTPEALRAKAEFEKRLRRLVAQRNRIPRGSDPRGSAPWRALNQQIWRAQEEFLTTPVYAIPPDPKLRLEVMSPTGPFVDQHGAVHVKGPGRATPFRWGPPKPEGRPRLSSRPEVVAEVKRLRDKGLSVSRIASKTKHGREAIKKILK